MYLISFQFPLLDLVEHQTGVIVAGTAKTGNAGVTGEGTKY